MTFGCPKAGLNAAAREAAKAPSQGTYQFSYFKIVNDSHHASYEVHFKSNYAGEPDLKYCVLVYCQQGWDPKTTKASVTKMAGEPARGKAAMHHATCAPMPAPARRRCGRSHSGPSGRVLRPGRRTEETAGRFARIGEDVGPGL